MLKELDPGHSPITVICGGPGNGSSARASARASVTATRQLARAAIRAAALLVIAGPSGCDSHVHLGMIRDGSGSLLWSATFERGDLSEWADDGQGGNYLENDVIPAAAATDVAHNGHFAGKCAVTPALGLASESYVFRRQPSPRAAYYGAWFYLSPPLAVGSWLSLMHFNGSHTGDGRNVYPTWDVNLYPQPSGDLIAHLYDFVTQTNVESTSPVPVPAGRWVHFEVFMQKAADATGHVAVWQDDALILDAEDVVTSENDWMEWNAGAASSDLSPSPGVVYIDDAAISLSRIGAE